MRAQPVSARGRRRRSAALLAAGAALAVPLAVAGAGTARADNPVSHVILISIDGLHASDLAAYVAAHPGSALAAMSRTGRTHTQAFIPSLSDSFPGLLALLTGGTPRDTGVYYDDSYDRTDYPAGSNCTGTAGTNTLFGSSIDTLDSGGNIPLDTSINPGALPLDSSCHPVQPSDFNAVNTVFSVVHAAGLRTAWIDKHPAYSLVEGHGTPTSVDDLYTPEIDATAIPATHSDLRGGTVTFTPSRPITDWIPNVEAYDQLHVNALLNEIDGKSSQGTGTPGVPALFGMDLQSVSVAQKLVDPVSSCVRNTAGGCSSSYVPGGYNPDGSFTPQLTGALNYVDAQLGAIENEIAKQGLTQNTEIILTAKHGQSPIDSSTLQKPGDVITPVVGAANIAHQTADDVSLLWLTPGTDPNATAATLRQNASSDKCATVYAGTSLTNSFGDRTTSALAAAREPDVICQPTPGVIYSTSKKKVTEHGGLADDDRHVALLISRPGASAATVTADVTTAQVAPTILRDLGIYSGLDTSKSPLTAVRAEDTQPLSDITLPTSLPESPLALLLPLGGIAVGAIALRRRGRKARRAS